MDDLITFGKHRGKKWSEAPEQCLTWFVGHLERCIVESALLKTRIVGELKRRANTDSRVSTSKAVDEMPMSLGLMQLFEDDDDVKPNA